MLLWSSALTRDMQHDDQQESSGSAVYLGSRGVVFVDVSVRVAERKGHGVVVLLLSLLLLLVVVVVVVVVVELVMMMLQIHSFSGALSCCC